MADEVLDAQELLEEVLRDASARNEVLTELATLLRTSGIDRVVVCGLATDYCVKATALDGVQLGFTTAVLVDAIRAVDLASGDGQRALDEMAAAGVELVPGGLG